MLLGSQITLETVVILNRNLDFCNEYKEDLVLSDFVRLVEKYTPFVSKKSTNPLYVKHTDLINNIARNRNVSYTT